MNKELLTQILERFDVEVSSIDSAQKGYRNSTYRVVGSSDVEHNLIVFKREPDALGHIMRSSAIGEFLHSKGQPARHPMDERILRVFNGDYPMYAGLYNYLPGVTIPWEAYTRKHLLELGRSFSDMHGYLSEYEYSVDDPQTHDVLTSQLKRMRIYFQKEGVISAMSSKLGLAVDLSVFESFLKLVEVMGSSSNKQMLHMDFVRGNVLFAEGDEVRVSGIIDFEKASVGHPVLDVARTMAFLLVDCRDRDALAVQKAFFYSGYQKRGATSLSRIVDLGCDRTMEILSQLVGLFLFHDFYKFLLHNPYEDLSKNEHFVRTEDELLRRALISPGV